jgi:hypothetical protein
MDVQKTMEFIVERQARTQESPAGMCEIGDQLNGLIDYANRPPRNPA